MDDGTLHSFGGSQSRRPALGDRAPDFTARSTKGVVRLSHRRGRWVLLFTNPADFTPVCSSEIIAFAKAQPAFESLDCDLIGHSVDSLPSHLAWVRWLENHMGSTIDFPVLEDVGLTIARSYGMIDADSRTTATVRGVFVIDPDGFIQAVQFYPNAVGRCVKELLRLVQALQTARACNACTPEGWQPGGTLLQPVETDMGDSDITGGDCSLSPGSPRVPWFMRQVK